MSWIKRRSPRPSAFLTDGPGWRDYNFFFTFFYRSNCLRELNSILYPHRWGFRTMPISVPGHADHPFRDDGDHDSGMMPITRSGMIPIS